MDKKLLNSGSGRARVRTGERKKAVLLKLLPSLPNPPFQLALGAALVNVQIPLLLGQLVEIVAKYTREHVGSFMTESRSLGTQLLILYGIQVQQSGRARGLMMGGAAWSGPECTYLSRRDC